MVVISDDLMNRHLRTVVTCPLTTQLHPGWRSRLRVRCEGRTAEVAVDQIRALSKLRLIKKLDELEPESAEQLRLLISEMYGEPPVSART